MATDQQKASPTNCLEHLLVARDMASESNAPFLLYLIDMAAIEASSVGNTLGPLEATSNEAMDLDGPAL